MEELSKEAFLICIRLAFTQARSWELVEDALLYESPPEVLKQEADYEQHLPGLQQEFAAKGHFLEIAHRGEAKGHSCLRCKNWKKRNRSSVVSICGLYCLVVVVLWVR